MRIWTTHLRSGTPPVLVREGFSWGALLFGPLWLLAHRAWIAAALDLAAGILVAATARGETRLLLLLGLAVANGLFGRDMRRWSLERRGYTLAHVVAAPDEGAALARLLEHRPELAPAFLPGGAA